MVDRHVGFDQLPDPVVIKERLTRQILRSVMAQFSSLSEALLELVDNAFDEFDGVRGGKHLDIDITITKDSVVVENNGGKGMGVRDLQRWLNWGESHKSDSIGEYGQGGKAALGYLGSSWKIQAKRWDEHVLWEIREEKWDDVSSAEKEYRALPRTYDDSPGTGYCRIEIRSLKKRKQEIGRLRERLANTYRRYLEDGKAAITVNHEPVHPLPLPLYDGYKVCTFKEKTSSGLHVSGWIGRLKRDARVKREPRISGGMRLLRKGRLIKDSEYFGHHDFKYKASLGTLIGEVELSKVPVLPNKTGFDVDSPEWVDCQETMHRILSPHIDELLTLHEEEAITREEKKRVSQIRNMMIEALALIDKHDHSSSKVAEDIGRKRPETPAEEDSGGESRSQERKEVTTQKQPRTPSPENAVGRLRRLGRMPEWDLRILEPHIRSDWEQRQGHRCLLINKSYCLYEQREGDDLYLAETAALQLARPEEDERLDLKEYLEEVNLLIRAFCEVYELGKG